MTAWQRHERIGDCDLYLGDCLEVMPRLGRFDACVTDPPFGMNWDGKVTVGKNGHDKTGAKAKSYGVKIIGDDKPFDPTPFSDIKNRIFWGFNHFPERLSPGRVLVWIKRKDGAFGSFLSDAELAWCSSGRGVFCRLDQSLMAETMHRAHPTQKPVGIMVWCLEQFPTSKTILDPFMGSGTTGVACVQLGRKFAGIELDPNYFEIACRRIEAAVAEPRLALPEPEQKPTQETLL